MAPLTLGDFGIPHRQNVAAEVNTSWVSREREGDWWGPTAPATTGSLGLRIPLESGDQRAATRQEPAACHSALGVSSSPASR